MGSPQEERGKRGSLSGPHGSILEKNASACRVGPGHIRRPPDVPLRQRTLENRKRFQVIRAFQHATATLCRVKSFCCGESFYCWPLAALPVFLRKRTEVNICFARPADQGARPIRPRSHRKARHRSSPCLPAQAKESR